MNAEDLADHHAIVPVLIEIYHRWQCEVCHEWINYNEWDGRWWHKKQVTK